MSGDGAPPATLRDALLHALCCAAWRFNTVYNGSQAYTGPTLSGCTA